METKTLNSQRYVILPKLPFGKSFILFFIPYLVYAAWPWHGPVPMWSEWTKAVVVFVLILVLQTRISLPRPKPNDLLWIIIGTPIALLAWCLPLLLCSKPTAPMAHIATATNWGNYMIARTITSVLLASWIEEAFYRIWLQPFFHNLNFAQWKSWGSSLSGKWDALPSQCILIARLWSPAFFISIVFFVSGHQPKEYLGALAYFSVTQWMYHKSQSYWVPLAIHILVNLGLAWLVFLGYTRWWF